MPPRSAEYIRNPTRTVGAERVPAKRVLIGWGQDLLATLPACLRGIRRLARQRFGLDARL